jgi:hypothetical protein
MNFYRSCIGQWFFLAKQHSPKRISNAAGIGTIGSLEKRGILSSGMDMQQRDSSQVIHNIDFSYKSEGVLASAAPALNG